MIDSFINNQMLHRRMLGTKRLSIRIPEQMYNELQLRSDKTGNPMTSIVRQALNEYVYGKDVKE